MCQLTESIDLQRNKEIKEFIQLLHEYGCTPQGIVKRLIFITGLSREYISQNFTIPNMLEHEILSVDINYFELSQRNRTIVEVIDLYRNKGYRGGAVELKLSYLTGLTIYSIHGIRYKNKSYKH